MVGCWLEVCCVGGRYRGHGCGRNTGSGGMLVVLVEILDGKFDCPLKELELWSMLSKLVVCLLIL